MTRLLEEAFAEAAKLPEAEQEVLAAWIVYDTEPTEQCGWRIGC